MTRKMNRREALALGTVSLASLTLAAKAEGEMPAPIITAHDKALRSLLDRQVKDATSRWCGGLPDASGLYHCGAAAHLLRDAAAAYFHPQSAFHASQDLFDRMKLAADFLARFQNEDGNIDLLSTNFNSPPDTGFVVHNMGTAARLASLHDDKAVLTLMEDFLRRAGQGMAKGGIHTPNHRWVVSSALAQIHELFPDDRYVKRIDAWLAEGIDIDEEGQYTERSTGGYNTVVDRAFVVMAHKLKRPELLEPVRKNLDAMAYLLHPNGEVVTEISHRQDSNTRATMRGYWFPLRYLAVRDGNGLYAAMLEPLEPENMQLAALMEYPDLQKSLPPLTPIPEDYEKEYPRSGITRIRRGRTSVTIIHKENSRWISLRQGEAVINAVRFASAFFGKGQFSPAVYEKRGGAFYFSQELKGWYYQPITDTSLLPVQQEKWSRSKIRRKPSELCELVYEGRIRETEQGFEVSIEAKGTANVPLAVEINLREGGELTGVSAVPRTSGAFLLKDGFAEYRMGPDVIRFGPGRSEHAYVAVRGAEAKLPGPSVYLTGYTPFQHTLVFQLGSPA